MKTRNSLMKNRNSPTKPLLTTQTKPLKGPGKAVPEIGL